MECGKGTCVADLSYPLGFKCQCDQGWSRNDDGYADLAFRPCVIPNCKFFFLQFFKINYLWLYAINLSHKKYSLLLLLLFSKSPLLDRTLYNLGEYKSRAPLSLSLSLSLSLLLLKIDIFFFHECRSVRFGWIRQKDLWFLFVVDCIFKWKSWWFCFWFFRWLKP